MKRLVMVLKMLVLQNLCVVFVQPQITSGNDIHHRIIVRWLQAAQNNDTAKLDYYLSRRINIDVQDDDGKTALIKAAESGHIEIVRRLIEQGALLNIQDWYGNTALIKASINGYGDIVKLLIAAKAKLMKRNSLGGTVLIEAAAFGQTEIVRILIPAMKAAYEATADLDVSYMGIDLLRQLMLSELLNPLDVQDNFGLTALMQAALRGYVDIVALLIEAGADPLVKDNEGHTAQVLVMRRSLKNKDEVAATLLGEPFQPAPKKKRVAYQRNLKK